MVFLVEFTKSWRRKRGKPCLRFVVLVLAISVAIKGTHMPLSCVRNDTELGDVRYDYKTSVVENEYIVLFEGYYPEPKRDVFVSEALSSSHVPSWEVIPRNNPARQFPSDFSLIRLRQNAEEGIEALQMHPRIRKVTPQRKVQRFLHFTKDDQQDGNSSGCPNDCWSVKDWSSRKGTRSSLSMGQSLSFSEDSSKGRKLLRAIPRQITQPLQADILWSMGYTGSLISRTRRQFE